jgi:hypothetical protein
MSTSHSVSAISNSHIHQHLDPSLSSYLALRGSHSSYCCWVAAQFPILPCLGLVSCNLLWFGCSVCQHLLWFWTKLKLHHELLGSQSNYSCNGFIIVWIHSCMYVCMYVFRDRSPDASPFCPGFHPKLTRRFTFLAFALVSVDVLGSALIPFGCCDWLPSLTATGLHRGRSWGIGGFVHRVNKLLMVDSVMATVELIFALSRDGGDLIAHDEGSSCAYCVDFMLQPEFSRRCIMNGQLTKVMAHPFSLS